MPGRSYIIFGDIEGKLDVLRVECTKCARKGRYSVRRLIEKYGRKANMMKWKEQLNGDCPRRDAERRRRCVRYLIQNALSSRSSWKPYSVTRPWPWARQWRRSLKNSNVGTASSVSGARDMPSANVRRND